MIRNYNLLNGSRDTMFRKENVTDVDISPTSFTSKGTKLSTYLGWLTTFLLMFSLGANAQVANYVFSQSSGTYTPITGGTNLASTTAAFVDDNNINNVAIGFPFTYDGIVYNNVGINANGWISMGSAALTSSYVALQSSFTSNNNNIAAFNNDIICRQHFVVNRTSGSPTVTVTQGNTANLTVGSTVAGTGMPSGGTVVSWTPTTITLSANVTSAGTGSHMRTVNASSGIRYETIGSSPNRKFVVQFTGFSRYTTTASNGDLINFQIVLNETSNTIDYIYDMVAPNAAGNYTMGVGLRGSSAASFNTRTSTTSWAATTAGGANSATVDYNNTVFPASGLTFTFTPPAPPVVPPNCASGFTPADLATGVPTLATLTWASATGNPATYDVYFGTSPTPPLVTNTVGLSYNTPALTINTVYYWKIVPKNVAGDAIGCSTQSFTTTSFYTYCTPTNASGCSGDNIVSVSLNSLSDTGLTCTPNYEDRSGVQNSVPNLAQNNTESLTLVMGTDGNQYNRVWIDFNQNGTFDSSESFSLGTNALGGGTQTIPMLIPAAAPLGLTKMRIRAGNDGQSLATEACGAVAASAWGVSRDYTVNIVAALPCSTPSSVNASAVGTTTATLNWACTGCTGTFRVEYNTSPATFGGVGNIVIDPATTGTPISGLAPNTNYTFFVRQDCGVDGFGNVAAATFKTATPGENCVDALPVIVAPDAASAPNTNVPVGATADGPAGTCSNGTGNPNKQDRWISFVAPSNGNKIVIITSAASTGPTVPDTIMQVWSGCPATGSAMGCSDDINTAGGNLYSRLEFCQNQYVGGQTYYVQVWPYTTNTAGNAFNIKIYEEAACPLPPDNDECAGIVTIPIGLAGSCPDNATFGTTTNATASGGIATNTCDPFATYLDVMYTFNSGPNTDMSFTFDNITGTNHFSFYGGCGTTPLGICDNGDYNTIITGMTPNTDYYLLVYATSAANMGDFSICLNSLSPPACVASPVSPANGATDVSTCADVTLSWNSVADAIAYDIYLDAGAGPATTLVAADQAGFIGLNTYNAGALADATQYSWRVVPKNSAGSPTGCSDFTFTTATGISTPGDTFAGAVDLGVVTTSVSANGDTTCYSNDYNTTSTPGNALGRATNDAFFRFEVTCENTFDIGLCTTNFDTYMHILDSTGARIGGDDDSCPENAGSLLEDYELAPGVYYVVVEGWSGSGTFTLDIAATGGPCSSVVNLKLFVEGYYIGGGAMQPVADNQAGVFPPVSTDVEEITVELHDAVSPYALVDTTTAMLQTDGTAVCNFSTSPNGSFYIAVKTRNAVQTWSADPQPVGTTPLTYNFTNAGNKAYGDNMIEIETGVFAFFSGDITDGVSQDGLVDSTDYSIWEADNNVFAFGSYATDLNGDGLVDSSDYSIWEANNNNFIFANYPF